MRRNKILALLLFIGFSLNSRAQITLGLKELGDSLIKRNFALRLVRLQADIAEVQNSFGAAGELPNIGVNGIHQNSVVNTRQEFFNGDVREADGAENQVQTLGVRLNWNLFNGFAVLSTRTELALREDMAEINTLIQLETELMEAALLYYEILAREQLLKSIDSSLAYSLLRVNLEKKQWELGKSKRLDYLQSVNDLNADSALWLQEKSKITNLYTELTQRVGFQPDTRFAVSGKLEGINVLTYPDLLSRGLAQNSTLQVRKLEERSAWNTIRFRQSERYPQLSLFGEYNFLNSRNAVGILRSNQTVGPAVGIAFSYSLFDGLRVNRDISVARLQREAATIGVEKIRYDIELTLRMAFEDYLLQKRLVAFEEQAIEIARENLKIARIQLNAGTINSFQFREVQQSCLLTENRFTQAQLALKQTELSLMQLTGGMLEYVFEKR